MKTLSKWDPPLLALFYLEPPRWDSSPPPLSSKVPLREPTSTCICSLFKTASSFDLWYCANVMPVIKGQYVPNQRITLWFPSKAQGFKGVQQPLQHRGKRLLENTSQNLLYHYFVKQNHFIFRLCFTYFPWKVIIPPTSPASPTMPLSTEGQ